MPKLDVGAKPKQYLDAKPQSEAEKKSDSKKSPPKDISKGKYFWDREKLEGSEAAKAFQTPTQDGMVVFSPPGDPYTYGFNPEDKTVTIIAADEEKGAEKSAVGVKLEGGTAYTAIMDKLKTYADTGGVDLTVPPAEDFESQKAAAVKKHSNPEQIVGLESPAEAQSTPEEESPLQYPPMSDYALTDMREGTPSSKPSRSQIVKDYWAKWEPLSRPLQRSGQALLDRFTKETKRGSVPLPEQEE